MVELNTFANPPEVFFGLKQHGTVGALDFPRVFMNRTAHTYLTKNQCRLLGACLRSALALLVWLPFANATEEFQNWHGFNWHVYQTTNFDASAYGEVRYRDSSPHLFQSLFSPKLTWKAWPNLDLGLNYTWFANRTKTGEFADTHRLEAEVNPHVKITDWLEFHNRNRLEIYWTDGVNGERYRSRNRLQFTVPLKGFAPLESIYCNNEFWYIGVWFFGLKSGVERAELEQGLR